MIKDTYTGKYIQVKEHTIDGTVWERVWLRGGIAVYPINEKGEILMVRELRPHETPNTRIKPVTGIYEDEYSLFENVNREMQEEIGFKCDEIELLWEINNSGTINNFLKFVVARGLSPSKIPNPDGEETIQEIIPYTVEKLKADLLENRIPLRTSMMGVFKL